MFRNLTFIWKSSMRNRRRSALTLTSIAVSFCLLAVLMAMYRALFVSGPGTPAQAVRMITHHKVGLAGLMPVSYEDKIRRLPGVREVMLWQWFGGSYKDARDRRNFFARFAVEPDRFFTIYSDIAMPEEQKQAFFHERTGCIVNTGLAKKFGWKLGDRITLVGDIFPVTLDLKLVGIYTDPENHEALFFNKEYLRESLGADSPMRDAASMFEVRASGIADAPRAAASIDRLFDNSPAPTRTESERSFELSFVAFLGNLKLFLLAICGAVTFTILLVSANTLSMSVRERVREVGILKTLGFTKGAIAGLIAGEAGVIAVSGGALGIAFAGLLCGAIRNGVSGIQNLRALAITPELVLLALGIALFTGLLSSLVPALSASRTTILDSLRDSG
jgi:putative ABC transport system permease protein